MRRLSVIVFLLLAIAGTAYLVRGVYFLFTSSSDFHARWVEEQYVLRGKNPFDIFFASRDVAHPATINGRNAEIESDLGPTDGGYPPWAYASAQMLTSCIPNFKLARVAFATVNLLMIGGLMFGAYRYGSYIGDNALGFCLAIAFLATSSVCTTLGLGQYGVVAIFSTLAAYYLDQKGRWFLAGTFLFIAFAKVTLVAPLFLPFVLAMRWRSVTVLLVQTVIGTLAVSQWLHASPLELIRQTISSSVHYLQNGYSLIDLARSVGLPMDIAMKGVPLACVAGTCAILWLYRGARVEFQLAVCAFASRAWTYHNLYDNIILVLGFLGFAHFMRQRSRIAWFGFWCLGASLWLPARFCDFHAIRIAQAASWFCAFILLLITYRNAREEKDRSDGRIPHLQPAWQSDVSLT